MSKSIRQILVKYGREVYLYTNSANQEYILDKSLEQALSEIQEVLDDAKPQEKDIDAAALLNSNYGYNFGINDYQQNIKEAMNK